MFTEIVLNVQPLEKRLAVLEGHQLVELYVEKEKSHTLVGNIYKGIVKNVLPGIGAAFVDIGLERTAFLHYTDLINENFDLDDDEIDVANKFLAKALSILFLGLLETHKPILPPFPICVYTRLERIRIYTHANMFSYFSFPYLYR